MGLGETENVRKIMLFRVYIIQTCSYIVLRVLMLWLSSSKMPKSLCFTEISNAFFGVPHKISLSNAQLIICRLSLFFCEYVRLLPLLITLLGGVIDVAVVISKPPSQNYSIANRNP